MLRKATGEDFDEIRKLWELAFPEDSAIYLDYYFKYVMDHNKVLLLYEKEETSDVLTLIGMLHMNPYVVYLNGEEVKLYYIVAVATHPEHRRKGVMRKLLEEAKRLAEDEKVHSLILLPEDERFYGPFGYQFKSYEYITTLKVDLYQGRLKKPEKVSDNPFSYKSMSLAEVEAWFVNNKKKYQNYEAVCTKEYIRRLYNEVICETGKVITIDGHLVLAYFDDFLEVRKYYLRTFEDSREEEESLGFLANELVEMAKDTKLVLHEVNERKLSKQFAYSQKNTYEYRPYMMVLPLKEEIEDVFFDEDV